MSAATAFFAVMLFIVAVCGWGYAWAKVSDWVEEQTDSPTLGMFIMFSGAFGLPIATLVAAIVGSMP